MYAFLLLTATLGAAPAVVQANSSVDEVTVYQGTAKVTRLAHIELPAGDVQVVFPELPESLTDDSINTEGKGIAKARIFGAQVERVTHEETLSAEARAAQQRLRELEDKDRSLADKLKIAEARKKFVDSLKATYAQERNQNLATRPVEAKELAGMSDFVARQTEVALEQERSSELARRELAKQINAARSEVQKLSAKRNVSSKSISVDLQVKHPGSFDLKVSYLVPGPTWSPNWDARLDVAKGTVELSLSGLVSQASGEDWNDVKLALSTAQPSRALYVPELYPQYLDRRPQAYRSQASAAESAPAKARAVAMAPVMDSGGELRDEVTVAERPTATVQQGLLSTSYVAPRRESIGGTGRSKKALLSTQTLKADVRRLTAPSRDAQVYLTARAINDGAAVLLAGPVNVFLGDEFLGKTQLPTVPPQDEVKLAFGADHRVKVERKLVERKHDTSGLFSKEDSYRYHFRTTVKNLYTDPTTVTLLDQVPVSRDSSIQIKVLDGSTPATEKEDPSKPGVRAYKLTLNPGVEKAIDLLYEVRSPQGVEVAGLE
jgi:uncharacterized protein (TIGR02231 family)